jgi:TetR/AcrR family transcriptional repressor of nem operon
MARPREFDIDEILSQVMEIFWKDGYEKTSFALIEEQTGVKKASLCAAFGDKRSLFLKALRHYQKVGRQACQLALNQGGSDEVIRQWFSQIAENTIGENARQGCLHVNTIIELAARDAEVAALVREHIELISAQVAEVIVKGQRSGQFRTDVKATSLATYLVISVYGLVVVGKAAAVGKEMKQIVDVILSGLEK